MGCGFCVIVAAERADAAVALLERSPPGRAVIGRVTDRAGVVELPGLGIAGDRTACSRGLPGRRLSSVRRTRAGSGRGSCDLSSTVGAPVSHNGSSIVTRKRTRMSTPLGTRLNGRYRLEARIGAGGMSTVYRAFDETLERQVAVKLMNREVASDSDQLERFRREARAVAQLSHPHIVGRDRRRRGRRAARTSSSSTSRARRSRSGSAGWAGCRSPRRVAYAIEIARALGAAHARHIVHRDVKPQNVLIDHEGSAKVTDFGIARTLEEEGLTADGRVLGTTDYVSPEQALGQHVTGPVRPLLARDRALRDAHRRGAVQRREPGRGGDEARPRGDARRRSSAPRGLGGAGRGGRHARPPSARASATPTTPR